jgi:hypothetical protein
MFAFATRATKKNENKTPLLSGKSPPHTVTVYQIRRTPRKRRRLPRNPPLARYDFLEPSFKKFAKVAHTAHHSTPEEEKFKKTEETKASF